MKTRLLHPILLILLAMILTNCAKEVGERFAPTKYAFGKAGKISVLVDEDMWERQPGDTLRFYFGSAFPILPQPEPIFDLQHQTFDDLVQDPIRKELRSFVIAANLADKDSPITKMVKEDLGERLESGFKGKDYQLQSGTNKWAQNQLIMYIIGRNESALIDGIKASLPSFTKRMYEFDKLQYEATLFVGGHNVSVENKLKEAYGISMEIPDRFKVGIDKEPFLWLQDPKSKITNGLIFYAMPYTSQSQFSEENMVTLRDSLTKAHISAEAEGSYMQINNIDLPTFYYQREIDGQYAGELRGIWDMKNEFMGGAFVSFLIHQPERKQVLFVDGFVFGPGQKKREAVKQLIYLIEGISLD